MLYLGFLPFKVSCRKNTRGKEVTRLFNHLQQVLQEANYKVYSKIMDSSEHGLPQKRLRLYIVAIRTDVLCSRFRYPLTSNVTLVLDDIIAPIVDWQPHSPSTRNLTCLFGVWGGPSQQRCRICWLSVVLDTFWDAWWVELWRFCFEILIVVDLRTHRQMLSSMWCRCNLSWTSF